MATIVLMARTLYGSDVRDQMKWILGHNVLRSPSRVWRTETLVWSTDQILSVRQKVRG